MVQRQISAFDSAKLDKLLDECADIDTVNDPIIICDKYFETWQFACGLVDFYGYDSIEELMQFDEGYSVEDWAFDFMLLLEEACDVEKRYGSLLIDFCREYIKRSDNNNSKIIVELKEALAEAYFRIGGQLAGDIEFERLTKEYPSSSTGWLKWAEQYSGEGREIPEQDINLQKAISILKRARNIDGMDLPRDVLKSLYDLFCQTEREAEAEEVLDILIPLDDDEDDNDGLGEDVAVQPGRNAPCPCGSGKKYKKCCGVGSL